MKVVTAEAASVASATSARSMAVAMSMDPARLCFVLAIFAKICRAGT